MLIYAEPEPGPNAELRSVVAAETGFEGVACVDDTARAALLALAEFERSGSPHALRLARRWLTFISYMQYADGSFSNFIRNMSGTRNATGATSVRGGLWWSARALWALARAYRLTGDQQYLDRFSACHLNAHQDSKINALLVLAESEIIQRSPMPHIVESIERRCESIITNRRHGYFLDHAGSPHVHLWGYHQLHAVAGAARILDMPAWLEPCQTTVDALIEPDVRHQFWYDYPGRRKDGVCAYTVSPVVQGLGALYRATGTRRYRDLALAGSEWLYGRNDAQEVMYDARTGKCRDGITDGVASRNFGAESSIEAGFIEIERRALLST